MERKETDNQNDKTKILEGIIKKVETFHLTPYEISKNTGLSDTGVRKLLDGKTKNPSIDTLNRISKYLDSIENSPEKCNEKTVDLELINSKLDFVISKLEKMEDRMGANELMQEIMYELQKNSSSPEELKKIEKGILKKQASS